MESIYGQKIYELAEAEYREYRSIFIEEVKGADDEIDDYEDDDIYGSLIPCIRLEILESFERKFTGTGFTEDGCKDHEIIYNYIVNNDIDIIDYCMEELIDSECWRNSKLLEAPTLYHLIEYIVDTSVDVILLEITESNNKYFS